MVEILREVALAIDIAPVKTLGHVFLVNISVRLRDGEHVGFVMAIQNLCASMCVCIYMCVSIYVPVRVCTRALVWV